MITKTKLALAALLMLGMASAVQAGGKDDADSAGGYSVGPLGQRFPTGGDETFGYVPRPGSSIRSDGRCWEMTANGNHGWVTCPQ
jgi:hypothetical protein